MALCFALFLKLSNSERSAGIPYPGKSKSNNVHTFHGWIQSSPFLLSGEALLLTLANPAISTEILPISTFPAPRKKKILMNLKCIFLLVKGCMHSDL